MIRTKPDYFISRSSKKIEATKSFSHAKVGVINFFFFMLKRCHVEHCNQGVCLQLSNTFFFVLILGRESSIAMARAANYCFMVTLQKKPSPESEDPELSFLRKNNSTAFAKPRYFDGEMLSLIFVGQFASSSRKLIYSRKSCVFL